MPGDPHTCQGSVRAVRAAACRASERSEANCPGVQDDKDPHLINRMSMTQFKSLCSAAHVPSAKFSLDRIEEPVKAALATAPAESAGTMSFRDFLMALVHVAHTRFAAHVRIHTSIRHRKKTLILVQQTANLTVVFHCAETRPFGTLTSGRQAG